MKLAIVAAAVGCSGCLVMPATRTTRRTIGSTEGTIRYGRARARIVDAKVTPGELGALVAVHVRDERECARDVFATIEVTDHPTARLTSPDDPRGGAFAALLAPITLPISALVTGATLLGGDGVTRESRPDHVKRFACSTVAAGASVAIALPSGRTLEAVTDVHGDVALRMPDTEPYAGSVRVRSGTGRSAPVPYVERVPPVTAVRDAMLACAAEHGVTGPVELQISVDPGGAPQRLGFATAGAIPAILGLRLGAPPDAEAALAACVTRAVIAVRFPPGQRGLTLVLPFVLGSRAGPV